MTHEEKKLKIVRDRAEMGDSRAQYELGLKYYRGEGVAQDMNEARVWLTKAAEQGQRDAQVLLNLRGLRLNQGVEIKLSAVPKSAKPQAASWKPPEKPKVKPYEEYALLTGTPEEQMVLLASQSRDAVKEAQEILPDDEPLKERVIEGLNAFITHLDSGKLPTVRQRGLMSLGGIVYRGLEEYGGRDFDAWKAKVYRIGRAFEDLRTGDETEEELREAAGVSNTSGDLNQPPKDKYEKISRIADRIEAELRKMRWWSDDPPAPEQMEFRQAFAMDTMAFSQWIQWVLLARIRSIIKDRGQFPMSSSVGSHAVREFDGYHDAAELISALNELDDAV